jgi:hypothetical protein
MDNLDSTAPAQPNASDLQAQYDTLRHLVVSILILVIVISGTFNIYLLRQWRSLSRELAGFRPVATQEIAGYQKGEFPYEQEFVKKLTEYGQTHADFVPILTKHNLKPAGSTGVAPASTTSLQPAAAPKK